MSEYTYVGLELDLGKVAQADPDDAVDRGEDADDYGKGGVAIVVTVSVGRGVIRAEICCCAKLDNASDLAGVSVKQSKARKRGCKSKRRELVSELM